MIPLSRRRVEAWLWLESCTWLDHVGGMASIHTHAWALTHQISKSVLCEQKLSWQRQVSIEFGSLAHACAHRAPKQLVMLESACMVPHGSFKLQQW